MDNTHHTVTASRNGGSTLRLLLFAQYEAIKMMRDYLAHRTADRQPDGKYAAHNEATSRRDEDNQYFEFALDDLRNAITDLNGIAARLSDVVYPGSPNTYPVSVPPWKYKQIRPSSHTLEGKLDARPPVSRAAIWRKIVADPRAGSTR